MDMFSGLNGEIVMDFKDYIRSQCGDNIANHIEFYVSFYERILTAYESYDDFESIDNCTRFIEDVECEL